MDREKYSDSIAAVQVYFDFLCERDRFNAAMQAHEQMSKGDVRILTVEVVLSGKKSVLPLPDKVVVEVAHPAWYKAAAINYGAQILIKDGYRFVAWFDADSFISPIRWGQAAVSTLQSHNIIQLGETIKDIALSGNVPAVTIARELHGPPKANYLLNDGGGWAAHSHFFTRGPGLWPYSMVEGGNKVMLYPFMKDKLAAHPLLLATQGTEVGASLDGYWKSVEEWNGGRELGYLRNYELTLVAHGSAQGRALVWAKRYGFYRQLSLKKDVSLSANGFPVVTNPRLLSLIELVLRERAFPSAS